MIEGGPEGLACKADAHEEENSDFLVENKLTEGKKKVFFTDVDRGMNKMHSWKISSKGNSINKTPLGGSMCEARHITRVVDFKAKFMEGGKSLISRQ